MSSSRSSHASSSYIRNLGGAISCDFSYGNVFVLTMVRILIMLPGFSRLAKGLKFRGDNIFSVLIDGKSSALVSGLFFAHDFEIIAVRLVFASWNV